MNMLLLMNEQIMQGVNFKQNWNYKEIIANNQKKKSEIFGATNQENWLGEFNTHRTA